MAQLFSLGHKTTPQNMKIDLYKLSNRLAKLACVAIVIRVFISTSPHWLAGVAATAAVCSLVTMLADEIIERKCRELAEKPFVEPK